MILRAQVSSVWIILRRQKSIQCNLHTRHVHRILYVSTVSWVNLTITILPGPTRKPHILLLFWVTQCNTNVYYKLQVYYLSKVVTQYKGKLCNSVRESYARESFCRGVPFLPFWTVHISNLNRYLTTAFYESWECCTCCAVQLTCIVWTQEGKRHKASRGWQGPGSSGYRVRCHCTANLALARHPRWVEQGEGEHSTVSVLLIRGTAAKAPLMEHNARELFYGGPRPCG